MAQLDDKTLQNLNKRLKEMDEILASDYRKALDFGNAFTQGFSTEQIDAFLRKLGKINRADAAKLNVMFNLVDINGRPITVQEAKYRIEQLKNAIERGQASTKIRGTSIVGLGSMTNELKRYKDALSVLGMSTSQQFDLISRNVKRVNNEVKGLQKGFGDMLPTLQRLASAFGVAFSVRGLAQFGKKLIETRGEFEMQFVAMKQIIGDVDAATKIWNQTMQQALQSPFKAMQLVTYTKQLAAYRIETEKLFDTTKRLADISAGLGVDMGRLILAFGQVKSANFLRASEVRQFTEAGVNIAGGLAKYFTELEGRAVGTAEVMERITKRMVLFSDVEEVFKRMTDEGGEFYNMQEVQADTVKGQINKLHDAYDQMLNTIGQGNQGTIRDLVDALNNLVRHWRDIASFIMKNVNAMVILVPLIATFRKGAKLAAGETFTWSRAMKQLELDLAFAGSGMKKFSLSTALGTSAVYLFKGAVEVAKTALKTFVPLLAIEGILWLVTKLQSANRELENMKKELSDLASESTARMNEEIRGYELLIEKLKQTTEGTMARKEVIDEISQKYGKYLDFIVTEKTTIDELSDAYDNVVASIRNYTAEKIREEQQQRLEKGMYDEHQDLVNFLFGRTITEKGRTSKLSKEQAKQIVKLIESELEKNPQIGTSEIYEVIRDYLGKNISAQEGMTREFLKFISKYKKLKTELQDIRDDIESNTPVFATEKDYSDYKKNVEAAELAIQKQKESSEEQINYLKEATRETNEQWIIDDRIAELRLANEEKILEIRKQYGLLTEDQYRQELARLHGTIDEYESDYNTRLENRLINKYGIFWENNKEARDMYNYVVSTEQALQQGTTQRNKQLIDTYKGLKDSLEQYKKALEAALASGAGQAAIAAIQANIDTTILHMTAIEEYASVLRGLDLSDKKKKTGRQENASKLISLIKEMRGEYDKLSKSAYGYAKSEEKVRDAYKDSVKEILGKAGITDYDFTTNEGMIKALEKVKSYATKLGKDAAAEVQKYIDQLETEIEINAQVRIREDFGKQMEEAFNDYELTLELEKLNIPKDAIKDIFPDFDTETLGELQDRMDAFYESQRDKDGNVLFDEDDLKEYRKWADKIDAEILKSRKEKAKEYSKYLEREYSERAKLEMQHAKDVAFVTSNISDEKQRDNIVANLNRKFQQDLNELNWKSFKESSFYVDMMDDLASLPKEYMQTMLNKIDEILKHPETLSPRALKEAINARQKILEAQMNLEPLDVMKSSIKTIRKAMDDVDGKTWKQTKEKINEQIKTTQEEIDKLEEEARKWDEVAAKMKVYEDAADNVETAKNKLSTATKNLVKEQGVEATIAQYQNEQNTNQQLIEGFQKRQLEGEKLEPTEKDQLAALQTRNGFLGEQIAFLNEIIARERELQNIREGQHGSDAWARREEGYTSTDIGGWSQGLKDKSNKPKQRIQNLKQYLQAFKNFDDSFAKFNAAINSTLNAVQGMGNAFYDMFDALGGETDALTEGWKEFGNTMITQITQTLTMIPMMVAAFAAAGIAINSALGIIGLIAEALQLLFVAIGAIAKLHDAHYEREIEIQQKKIDDLKRAYDRLEKQIEKTFDTASYIRTYNEETQNLYEQIEALNKQIAAEEAKKNTDKDKLQDYKDKIQDAEDELDELKQKQIEVFGGIGEEGYRDAAQGFVDAWKSAFLETGDGLQGLQDHFDEFLNDWFVKQATMRVAGRMLEPLFRQIDSAVDQYGSGGTNVLMQELQNVREKFGVLAPQLSEALEELAGMWGLGGEGALSGLAAGIQGMTEEQANILEAYWNSVRGYTASIDMNVSRIAQILGAGGDSTNPQLQQLTLIAANTQATQQLLQSVTKSGHSQGGYGIKVFAD